jgi:hypothetical protein
MLHDAGEEIEHLYFPHTGMVSLVAVMQDGTTVDTATIGRGGVIGASAGLGAKLTFGRATASIGRRGGAPRGCSRWGWSRRGLIQIVDRRALEDVSCECYAVVRHNVDKIFPAGRGTHGCGLRQGVQGEGLGRQDGPAGAGQGDPQA